MDLESFQEVVEAAWRQLDAAIAGMDEADFLTPNVVEHWSAKDLLGHVSAWEQEALRLLAQFRAGEALNGISGAGADAYNAAESERRAGLGLPAIAAEHGETRRQLRDQLAALTEQEWTAGVRANGKQLSQWVGGALGGPLGPGTHAAEHAHHILVWRVTRPRA